MAFWNIKPKNNEEDIQILTLNDHVYDCYTNKVKGNKLLTYEMVQKKLTRNYHLAKKVKLGSQELCLYGCLTFLVSEGCVLWIKNYPGTDTSWFEKDMKKYNMLNEELGIRYEREYKIG